MRWLAVSATSFFVVLSLQGQGSVDFNNFWNRDGVLNCLTGEQVASSEGIVAQLYWSASIDGTFVAAGDPASVGIALGDPFPGYFGGGCCTLIEGVFPPGGPAYFQVRAWESVYGSSYEAARAAGPMNGRLALVGESTVFMSDTGNPIAIPPGLPVCLGDLIPAFTVGCPVLHAEQLGGNVLLFWDVGAGRFLVEETAALTPASWNVVNAIYSTNATEISVSLPVSVGPRFFRLRRGPSQRKS